MGIHSEALAMAELTGKDLSECKRARKQKDAEIRVALTERPDEDPAQVMCEVAFGLVDTAASSAGRDKQVQDPTPDKQVQDPEPEKQVKRATFPTLDGDVEVELEADKVVEDVKKAKAEAEADEAATTKKVSRKKK